MNLNKPYLQTTDMILRNSYFKDFYSSKTFKSDDDNNLMLPHVYETIPSVHYCQTIPPSISSSNNSYLIDSYLNYSNTCLLPPSSSKGCAVIVLNGQNYYLTPASDSSQTQLSTCSSASSTRPLTNS